MNLLLDTCVLSEFTKRQPDVRVVNWLDRQFEEHLYISVITIGELKHGVERLPPSDRRERINRWLELDVLERFYGRIALIDASVMLRWGSLHARLGAAGQPMNPFDALIAATALANDLIVVTRNTSDFVNAGVQLINPWMYPLEAV
ncbi:MAG TPA: type II toxin-antitoxin system VapC family toxin [Chloroflexi bacterium]|jgi:predicted nucleic acid-binding protein|nr:type II toxin-antitoxin system VapC family toxin [Chloroflexota bacterium]